MKKVNLLIVSLYLNNVILIAFNLRFINVFTENESNGIENFYGIIWKILLMWFIVYFVLSLLNIISIIIEYKNNDSMTLFKKMKRIKICLIPFWVINFIGFLPISIILLVAGHGFGFLIVPVFIFLSYTVLLLTSIFSILYLLNLRKNNEIAIKEFIVHIILQLLFVIDIIDTIYIIKKWGVKK